MGNVVRVDTWGQRRVSQPGDENLLASALAGSVAARERLFRKHYPRILRLSYRLLGREDEAEDLAQDVCLEALKSLDRVRDRAAFEGWLSRICVFRARSRIRHYAVLRRLRLISERIVDADQVVSKSAPPDVALELGLLYQHIQKLPPDVRIALVLRRVEGLEIAEIARHMGRSPATVKRRLAEGRTVLERLNSEGAPCA